MKIITPGAAINPFVKTMLRLSWVVFIVLALFQIIFFNTPDNIKALACIGLVWLIFTVGFVRNGTLQRYPLSGFLIFGFTLTQFFFPLLFTTLENKPVIYNLDLPLQVFIHSGAEFLVLLITHLVYRFLLSNTNRNAGSILNRLGFFSPPSDIQVWMMGFVGLLAFFYVYFLNPEVGKQLTGNAADKSLQSFIVFSYAPFLIPLGRLYGNKKPLSKNLWLLLTVYTVLLFILSIGRNSRGAFVLGFVSIVFSFFLGLLLGIFKTKIFTARNAVIAIVGIIIVVGPMADLATAMVNVRGSRKDVKAKELIGLTLTAFQDKKAIRLRREADNADQSTGSGWDERYLNNVFTARFCNLKFNDASLLLAAKVGEKNPYMIDYSKDRALGTLPDPVLKALHFNVDKNTVFSLSFGDYIYVLAGAQDSEGGFKTGHLSGTGMATFGWWYLLALGAGMFCVFYLIDKLVFVRKIVHNQKTALALRFSFCGLLALTSIFQFLPSESVVFIAGFLIRGYLQILIVYFILFHFTRLVSKYVLS